MKNLFCYSYYERIKFFVPTFIVFFLIEWIIYILFTPLQAYSYDYLVVLGYILFISLVFLNGYRFLALFSSKTIQFLKGLPIKGYFVIASHLLFSCLESILYFLVLFFFISRSLLDSTLLHSTSLVNPTINALMYTAIGKTLLLFLLLILVLYFSILAAVLYLSAKNKWLNVSILLLYFLLLVVMFIKSKIFSSFFIISLSNNPVSLFQLTTWDISFCLSGILMFVIFDIWLMNKFFSPYHSRG